MDVRGGAEDQGCQVVVLVDLVHVQRLVGQQDAVVQNIQTVQELSVNLHLTDQPGPLLTCQWEDSRGRALILIRYIYL